MITIANSPTATAVRLTTAQVAMLRLVDAGLYYLANAKYGEARAGRKKTLRSLLRANLVAHPAPGQKLHTLTPAGAQALATHDQSHAATTFAVKGGAA